MIGEDQLISETYLYNRKQLFVQLSKLNLHATMVGDTIRFIKQFDRNLENAYYLLADIATGETTQESKTIEYTYNFEVFATWWDHFKYDLKENRIWLSKLIPTKLVKKLGIHYITVTKKRTEVYPIKVLRACPHINERFEDKPYLHIAFTHPLQFRKQAEPC